MADFLGGFVVATDMLGGDATDPEFTLAPSQEMLGSIPVGWGMVGGEGTEPAAPGDSRLHAIGIRAGSRLAGHLVTGEVRLATTPIRAGTALAYVSLHQVTTQTRTYVLLGTAAAEPGIKQPSVIDREPVTARPPSLGW